MLMTDCWGFTADLLIEWLNDHTPASIQCRRRPHRRLVVQSKKTAGEGTGGTRFYTIKSLTNSPDTSVSR